MTSTKQRVSAASLLVRLADCLLPIYRPTGRCPTIVEGPAPGEKRGSFSKAVGTAEQHYNQPSRRNDRGGALLRHFGRKRRCHDQTVASQLGAAGLHAIDVVTTEELVGVSQQIAQTSRATS